MNHTMHSNTASITTLNELRSFIHTTLCERENLLAEQFGMKELGLMQGTRLCGVQFLLKGPRQIRLGAIWTADLNRVYFYDTRGERYLKVDLPHRLPLPEANALEAA